MRRSWCWHFIGSVLVLVAACGGDSKATGEPCVSDAQCKGDRVCEQGACVDPKPTTSSAGASGAGGSGGASGSGVYTGTIPQVGGVLDDPELEQACSLDCAARHEAACSMNIGSPDQCLAQCLVIDESSQGYCLDEMTARYACTASGGYSCVSGYPQPKSTCIAESTALSQCSQMIPCWSYCDHLPESCDAAGADCVSACTQQQKQFTDAICGIYYNQLLTCWARGVSCVDGKPAVGDCGPAVAEVADCVGRRNHECDGYCWAAATLGCEASDCVSACKAKTDAAQCGSYYRNVIDCAVSSSRELHLSCEAGTLTIDPTACATYLQQYESCMMTQ